MDQYKKKDFNYWCRKIWKDYICDWAERTRKKCRSIKYKIKYVFFPHNVIKIKTLNRSWMDRDVVLLHACFQILTDYVERECFSSEYHQLTPINIEKDMESYKEWDDESKASMRQGLEEQNRVAKEILDLYNWWKNREKSRSGMDPLNEIDDLAEEEANLGEFEVAKRDEYGDPTLWHLKFNKNEKRSKIYERSHEFEKKCDEEDEEMLIRLMKIRTCLWT